ncbi:MAG: 3-deoxy-manno-octulosonate cytidylyltransferase [Planctomycetaceae bacterium]|jgi:3-deoxy-manno-octulosonate cytidylyltransferase (CMP-KDO synthetase)|nr:3-deoxy-manno-octulosonate cytidylyltransferase [Planctomycetaceae bacterium]
MLQAELSSLVSIIIPSRYQSTRLPGKPLIKIAGIEMIKRVADIASFVCVNSTNCDYTVATDDLRIFDFCQQEKIPVVMTREDCTNGTERCWDAIIKKSVRPELIINMQGDNPICPPTLIQELIESWRNSSGQNVDLFTPSVQLSWEEYDRIIETKKNTPYSGTTVLADRDNFALAFSKSVIPVIRNIDKAKKMLPISPVRRHIGLYAYTFESLRQYIELPQSDYELNYVEGLEQMRFLTNKMRIKVVPTNYQNKKTTSGIDSPEDIKRVEEIISIYGDPFKGNSECSNISAE